jgi:hypothetical protein
MKYILSAATALAIIVGSSVAFADSGDGPQFGLAQPVPATGPATTVVTAAPLAHDVDIEAQPTFGGPPAIVALGGGDFLPVAGNESPLQTANSAPAGFGADTVTLAAHTHGFPHLALR